MKTKRFETLLEMLSIQSTQLKDQVVYRFLPDQAELPAQDITYGELDLKARAVAAELQKMGCAGERVVLLFKCDLDYIAGFFGCIYAGAVAVPLYPPHSTKHLPRLQAILKDCGAKAALTTASLFLTMGKMEEKFESILGISWLKVDEVQVESVLEYKPPQLTSESLAFLQYTSGSTGNPKGVMLSHSNLIANFQMISEAMQVRKGDVMVSWLPMYHDMGLIGAILHSVYAGIQTVLMTPSMIIRPYRWLEAISKYNGTITVAPNFAYDFCVQKISDEDALKLDLSKLRVAFNGAEPIKAETLTRFQEKFKPSGLQDDIFLSCYGLAEATLIVSGRNMSTPSQVKFVDREALKLNQLILSNAEKGKALVGCGQPCAGQSVQIIHPESLEKLPVDTIGEIWISGENIAQGYWNHPALTEYAFTTLDGVRYFRSGDLGCVDQNGQLYISGRIKDLIIVRGKNFAPHDLEESARSAHPIFHDRTNAAISVDHEAEDRVVLIQEMKRSQSVVEQETAAALIVNAIGRDFGLIVDVCFVESATIARTSSGKIRRQEMKKLYLTGGLRILSKLGSNEGARIA